MALLMENWSDRKLVWFTVAMTALSNLALVASIWLADLDFHWF